MTLRPSYISSDAKLWRKSYGRACARPAASAERLNARRRHDWYAACVQGSAFLAGEHELGIAGAPGGHPPGPQVRSERSEEANRAVLARLRVGLLAERDRSLDKQGLLADVSPTQTERFTRTKTRIREDGDECRVARVERCAHRLDRGRRTAAAPPPAEADLAFFTRRAGFADICPPTNACSKIEPSRSIACRTAMGPAPDCQAVGLPTPDDFRRDLTQRDRAEVRTEVMVVKARVVKSGLRCEGGARARRPTCRSRTRRRSRRRHQRCEASGPALPSDLRVEVAGVAACAERPRTVPAVLPPPHAPHRLRHQPALSSRRSSRPPDSAAYRLAFSTEN